ncbi:MAG: sugar phosphate isomerase/epimerase [Halothiobacillaceae bacterium]|nr:MAG: sugar phosphate isomerase/epimerase [Halothiobacillaceae bacterium]
MKLAYSTNAFTRTDLKSALRTIAELGFNAAEILCDRPHWFPGETTSQEAKEIRNLLEELNLQVSNLNINTANGYYAPLPVENVFEPSLTNRDPQLRQWRERYTIEGLKLAQQLHAPCISVTSGRPTPGTLPEEALDYFVASLKRICSVATDLGVNVGIEYEPGLLVENAVESLAIIERVDSPVLGVNFDIGHSRICGEEIATTVQQLAGRIWNVHVEDIKGRKHFHLIPGEGDLPFAAYFSALRAIDYTGHLTVELYSYPMQPRAAGERAFAYLSTLLATAS